MTVKKRSREAGNERGKTASCKERVALTGSKSGSLKGAGLCPRKNSSGVWNLRPMLRANCMQRKKKEKKTHIKQLQFNLLNNIKSTDWWKHTFKFKSNLPKHIMLFPDSLVFAGAEELHTQFHASRVETGQKARKYCAVSITGCILYIIPRQSSVCWYWKAPHIVSSIYCGNTARMLNICLQQASYNVFCKLFLHSLVFYFFFLAKPEMLLLSDNQKPAVIASMVLSLPGEDKICLRQSTIVNLPSMNLPLLSEGLTTTGREVLRATSLLPMKRAIQYDRWASFRLSTKCFKFASMMSLFGVVVSWL